ncbi:MAG: ABC transporter substrate-binding protein [Caldilineaceae bacterium]|nr:ABC transporter substrate-binding protein [Caldilineaceae bacterium]
MRSSKQWTFAVGVLLLMLLLAACTAPGAAPAAPVDPERAESLNIAVNGRIADPTNLNIYAPGVSRSGTGLHQMIYEYFFYQNLQTGEYVPWLAESYEYNDDFTAITVKLRDGVKWSDGEPFTGDDVVFTYETLMANPGMTWAAEVVKNVASVEAPDPLTVTFNLTASNPRYHLNREAFPAVGIWGGITILPKHIWEGEDPLTFKSSDPIGTGAYVLENATETAMTYALDEDWWGGEVFGHMPEPKKVNFLYLGPETNVALALTADELDTPNIGILSVGSFEEVKRRNPTVSAWTSELPYAWLDPCPRGMMVQNATPPWDKKEMRWALSYSVDRQAVVNLAYEGTTVPSWGIWPFYDGLTPYFEAISDLRAEYPSDAFDLAKAEELLTAQGYSKNADGKWADANGPIPHMTFLVDGNSNEDMKVGTVIVDQLNAAGFDVELTPLTGSVQSDTRLRGDYTLAFQAFCPGYIYENLELFHSKYFVPLGEPAPWYERNSFRYQNPDFDAVVDQMAVTPPDDEAVMIDLYHQAMAIWLDDLPIVPIVQAPALVPFNSRYWTGWPSAENPWNMPVSWWATWNLVLNGYPSPETGEWVGGIHSATQPVAQGN